MLAFHSVKKNTGKARMGGATRPSVFKLALRFKMKTAKRAQSERSEW